MFTHTHLPLGLVTLLTATALADPPQYTVSPAAPGLSGFTPTAINESSRVAGYTSTSPIVVIDGVPQVLGFDGRALDINDSGAVAGYVRVDDTSIACVFADGVLTPLDHSFVESSFASALNNAGTYCGTGYSTGAFGPLQYGFVQYMPGFFFEDHYLLWSHARDVNAAGVAVGDTEDGTGHVAAVIRDANGVQTNLQNLPTPYTDSFADGISDSGLVVGWMIDDHGNTRAFLYMSSTFRNLGTIGGDSLARSVNQWGAIVGSYTVAPSGTHAFLWHHGTLYDLNALIPPDSDWVLTDAVDINDQGEIVGKGQHDGEIQGFILRPISSPDTDCNASGIADIYEILAGTSLDVLGDLIPDECQLDNDFDGLPDALDNCPNVANAGQADFDGDGAGDACDDDMDDDGVNNDVDACDRTPPGALVEPDGNVLGDVDRDCDVDLVDFAIVQSRFTGPNGSE